MMSKLVSDLFEIFLRHHGENLFHFSDQNYRIVCVPVHDQPKLAVPLLVLVFFMILFLTDRIVNASDLLDNRQKIGDINSSLQDTLAGIRIGTQSFYK